MLHCVTSISSKSRKKSVTRTIRLEEDQEEALIHEAEKRGFSVNALIGHIFDRYITGYRFFDTSNMLVMGSSTINEFLGRLEINEISEIGDIAGQARIRSSLMQRGRKLNFENLAWYISQVLGENYGWYRCDYREEGNQATFHLTHQMGYKWSVFLESYITSAFNEILNRNCNTVTMINAVNIEVSMG